MNELLTPLAIIGLVLFGVAVILIALLFLQQTFRFFQETFRTAQLLRERRIDVRLTSASDRGPSPPPRLESRGELHELEDRVEPQRDTPEGWGFGR